EIVPACAIVAGAITAPTDTAMQIKTSRVAMKDRGRFIMTRVLRGDGPSARSLVGGRALPRFSRTSVARDDGSAVPEAHRGTVGGPGDNEPSRVRAGGGPINSCGGRWGVV